MGATHVVAGQCKVRGTGSVLNSGKAAPKAGSSKPIASLGVLYAHALAMEHEAVARYREFATLMADCGNDTTAELFLRLSEFEAEHAFHLAKKSVGINIPVINPKQYAWLGDGALVPEAHAFIFRMMTPRMALEIALRAEKLAKAFFERVRVESRHAGVSELAAELAEDEEAHIAWVSDALARLPGPFLPDAELLGDPTTEQQV